MTERPPTTLNDEETMDRNDLIVVFLIIFGLVVAVLVLGWSLINSI